MWNWLAALMLNRRRHDFGAGSPGECLSVRSDTITSAFDRVLEDLGNVPPLESRDATMLDALLAVKLTHYQCGPVARAVESRLAALGLTDVEFCFLGAHYVLRDKQTGLLHDLEAPRGVSHQAELPIASRTAELTGEASFAPVFERYAIFWLNRRQSDLG